jgi:cytochrome P450
MIALASIATRLGLGVIVLLVIFLVHRTFLSDPRRRHLPPKVPGPPIINHTFQHLGADLPERLMKWAEEYGEIYRTRSAATDFIWLNSPRAIKEIIDKRSVIYSSRQPMPMALGAASGGRRVTFMPRGKRWRAIRAIIHRVSNIS